MSLYLNTVTLQYGPGLNVEGKRIFVFNRRILSDESKEPQRIRLLPYEVSKPELYNGKSVVDNMLFHITVVTILTDLFSIHFSNC